MVDAETAPAVDAKDKDSKMVDAEKEPPVDGKEVQVRATMEPKKMNESMNMEVETEKKITNTTPAKNPVSNEASVPNDKETLHKETKHADSKVAKVGEIVTNETPNKSVDSTKEKPKTSETQVGGSINKGGPSNTIDSTKNKIKTSGTHVGESIIKGGPSNTADSTKEKTKTSETKVSEGIVKAGPSNTVDSIKEKTKTSETKVGEGIVKAGPSNAVDSTQEKAKTSETPVDLGDINPGAPDAVHRAKKLINWARIPYATFIGPCSLFPHEGEQHMLVVVCSKDSWAWTLFDRHYGEDEDPFYGTEKGFDNSFGPRACWRTVAFNEEEHTDGNTNACEALRRLIPDSVVDVIFFGSNDSVASRKKLYDGSTSLKYRNALRIPVLTVYVVTSYESCREESKEHPSESIWRNHLAQQCRKEDMSFQFLFSEIPSLLYRLHPENLSHPQIGPMQNAQSPREKYSASQHSLLKNITSTQWLHAKAADALYGSRPALIIDGSEEGLVITATTPVELPTHRKTEVNQNKQKTLVVTGFQRTTSCSSQLKILYEHCCDKIPFANPANIAKLLDFFANPALIRSTYPMFSTNFDYQIASQVLTEKTLLVHAVVRKWAFSYIMGPHIQPEKENKEEEVPNDSESTNKKPIVIVTGKEQKILQQMLDLDFCREHLDLPISLHSEVDKDKPGSLYDEADLLRQVEVRGHKQLTSHGLTSFLVDIEEQSKPLRNEGDHKIRNELLGLRVAKYFKVKDETGDNWYRGTIYSYRTLHDDNIKIEVSNNQKTESAVKPESSLMDDLYTVLYDDGETEESPTMEIYELLVNYTKKFEKNLDRDVRSSMDDKRIAADRAVSLLREKIYAVKIAADKANARKKFLSANRLKSPASSGSPNTRKDRKESDNHETAKKRLSPRRKSPRGREPDDTSPPQKKARVVHSTSN